MSEWFLIDDIGPRLCRPKPANNPDSYEFIQLSTYPSHVNDQLVHQIAQGTIHIHTDYTEEDLLSVLHAFGYKDMDAFVMEYASPKDLLFREDGSIDRENSPCYMIDHLQLADMIFRRENRSYFTRTFQSHDDAVLYIASVTGLDLSKYLDQKLMLVTTFEGGREQNFLTTKDEFLGAGNDIPQNSRTQVFQSPDGPDVYRFALEPDGNMCEARMLSMTPPEKTAQHLASFVSGKWNAGTWCNRPEQVSAQAKALLTKLLDPITALTHPEKTQASFMPAAQAGTLLPAYLKNLDTVFSGLDLMKVKRQRISVTQGSAAVECCGKPIVCYGDDQWLMQKNGMLSNGFREKKGVLYGQTLAGWGSAKSDESFRRAALLQFSKQIGQAMQPERTLEQTILNAKGRVRASVHRYQNTPTKERDENIRS